MSSHLFLHVYLIIKQIYLKCMGGLPGDVNEDCVTLEKQKKGWRMSCDVGEATEGLENDL